MTVELLSSRPPSRSVALAEDSFRVDQLSDWSETLPTERRGLFKVAMIVIGLVFVFGGFWAATAKIGGAVAVQGRVIAEGTNVVVQHLEGGIIERIDVNEGDTVQQGQQLGLIDVTAARSQLRAIREQQAMLAIQLGRWRAESHNLETVNFDLDAFEDVLDEPRVEETLSSQLIEFSSSRDALERRLAMLDAQIANENEDIASLQELLTNYTTQIDLVEKELAGLRTLLEEELTTVNRVTTMERSLAQLKAQLADAEFTINKSRHNITASEQEKEGLLFEVKEEASANISRLQGELNGLADVELRLRDRITRSVLKAPVDGAVFRINFKSVGAVLPAGETFVEIFPEQQDLLIESHVQSKDISEVRIGQKVDVVFPSDRLEALDPLIGSVTYVSTDTVVDERTGMAFYVVRTKLTAGQGDRTVLPGNVADVFLKTTPRTLVEYLLEPFTRFANRSFTG